VFEEILSILDAYSPIIVLGVIFLTFVLALLNRKKLAARQFMDFKEYKEDWKRSHMKPVEIDEDVRPTFNKWLKFNFVLGTYLARIGFSPNLASVLAFILSTASAYYFIKAAFFIKIAIPTPIDYILSDLYFALAVAALLLSGLIDILDGAIAHLTNTSTPFGDVLDNCLDKYADAVVLIAIICAGLVDPLLGLAALLGSLLVDYARARTMGLGLKETKVTIGERPFRMLMISIAVAFQFVTQLSVALNVQVPIGWHEFFLNSVQWGILIMTILTHLSTIQIVIHAKKNLPKKFS